MEHDPIGGEGAVLVADGADDPISTAFRAAWMRLPEPILLLDAEGHVLLANDACRAVFGETASAHARQLFSEPGQVEELLRECSRTSELVSRRLTTHGAATKLACDALGLRNDRGALGSVLLRFPELGPAGDRLARLADELSARDQELRRALRERELARRRATVLERERAQLADLARHDPLTGAANRRALDEALAKALRDARRLRQPLALLLVDIDHFKQLNDRQGHLEGDRCLIAVAEALHASARRPLDLVARYGGEEFAIVLPRTDAAGAVMRAQAIRREVRRLRIANPGSPRDGTLTVSVGIAAGTPGARITPEEMIDAADGALYVAKRAGRDQVAQRFAGADRAGEASAS